VARNRGNARPSVPPRDRPLVTGAHLPQARA
jgi:hypothetical protein